MPKVTAQLYLTTRKEWRAWLEKNHDTAKDIWLLYYKKHTGKPTIPYNDAVEEALCFGWIDSAVKRIDDEKHIQRYSPRKPNSVWSKSNKDRVRRMIKAKRMTPAGMTLVKAAKKSGAWDKAEPEALPVDPPDDLAKALARNKRADANFRAFPPSSSKNYIWWVNDAKREDTRKRRIKEVVKRAAKNLKPGMM